MRNHSDCTHYVSVDGTRGLCAWTNELIAGDTAVDGCPQFRSIAKCKNCFSYKPEEDGMGECLGLSQGGGCWAFAEMIAKQCPAYQAVL